MKKFYKFTANSNEGRQKEFIEFAKVIFKDYDSLRSVVRWIHADYIIRELMNYDGYWYEDPSTNLDSQMWGFGGLANYSPAEHSIVNTSISLGEL